MSIYEQSIYRAACYCRLSRDDEQDGTSVSIETQVKVLEDYCKSNNISVADFYCDDGFTGTNFDRPNFKRMMSDVNNGNVNMVVVKDLSRFGRNYIEVGKYIEDVFPEIGVRFVAIGDDVDTVRENTDLDFMLPLKNIFNQYYPADCSRKTRQAFVTKAKRGEFIGSQAPYGYKKSAGDKHILEIDEVTAPTVKWIFEMIAYHGYGYNKIARTLSDKKVITPAAYQAQRSGHIYEKDPYNWNLATIVKMMENTAYLGHVTSGKRRKVSFKSKREVKQPQDKWIVNENMHEPLISQQLWDDAHKRLEARKRTSRSGFENIFSGLIKCDKCGYALGISNASDRENYFCCNTYKKKGKDKCSIHYIRYDDLYECVLADLQELLREVCDNGETFRANVLKRLGNADVQNKASAEDEISNLETRIKELEIKFDRLYDDRLNGILSDRKFKELSAKCEAEQDRLTLKLSELREQSDIEAESERNVDRFMALVGRYETIQFLDKELLNRLVDKITVSDKIKTEDGYTQKITVYYKFIGKIV